MQAGFKKEKSQQLHTVFVYTVGVPNNKAWILLWVTPLQVLILPLNSGKQLQISTSAEKSSVEESGFWWLVDFITTAFISPSEYSKMKIYCSYDFISTCLDCWLKEKSVWSCFILAKQSWDCKKLRISIFRLLHAGSESQLIIDSISALVCIQVLHV